MLKGKRAIVTGGSRSVGNAIVRAGTPGDVVSLAPYLALDAAAYITGQVIPVDGGLSI